MNLAAALIYWLIISIWVAVFGTLLTFYIRNPRLFGTTRLLLAVLAIDTLRNIVENVYFGVYFGAQYGLFPPSIVVKLGAPYLLILPKVVNVIAGCVVLWLLLLRWLPSAVREHSRSEQTVDGLKTLAAVDGLTGLYNRRHFETLAQAEWARFRRYLRPLSILMIDIDYFKTVNDRFGHDIGDLALKAISTVCNSAKRDSDIAARIGGEEFALLLPEANEAAALVVAERFCKMVREWSSRVQDGELRITVSIGVASATASMSGYEALMKKADGAPYIAKRVGRDRVASTLQLTEAIGTAAE